jgi:tight adherence protein C
MSRLPFLGFLAGWVGLSVLFSLIPALQRQSLADRLRAYTPTAPRRSDRVRTARSLRDVIGPLATLLGGTIAKLFGVNEDLRDRLRRVHADESATEFRVRQTVVALWSTLGATLALGVLQVPLLLSIGVVWVAPLLGILCVEQSLALKSERWKRDLEAELPVIAEQLAMLLAAGFSLSSAINRLANRGDGATAADLRRAMLRVRQGISEGDALTEWAELSGVASVDRVVAVLRLNTEASDLGRLVSAEAKVCREEGHRRLLASMEKKSQAVWIPVTVAALVPGVIVLSIPFIRALSFFSET